MNNKVIFWIIIVFVLAFSWQLFLTYGFRFFWEDFDYFRVYNQPYEFDISASKRMLLFLDSFKGFFQNFFSLKRSFEAGFNPYSHIDRPYQFLTCDLMRALLGDNAFFYRVLRSLVFALNTTIIFLLIYRISLLLSCLGAALYMTTAEVWASVVYASDTGILAQCGVLLSMLFFIKLCEKRQPRFKDSFFYYGLILLCSNFAILSKGDGKYLAVVFLLMALIFKRKQLRFHLPFIIILAIVELPVLGTIKMVAFGGTSPINIASHGSTFSWQSLKMIASNYGFPREAMGKLTLFALGGAFLWHLISIISNKTNSINMSGAYKEKMFFFISCFLSSFIMSAVARSFNYSGPYTLQVYDLIYFMPAFILFFIYYVSWVAGYMGKKSKVVLGTFFLILMLAQVLGLNMFRMIRFRAGHGNYFFAWQNTEDYINEASQHALVLAFTEMHYKPFVFRHSSNEIINTTASCAQSDFCDLGFIASKFQEKGLQDVFVVSRQALTFRGNSRDVLSYDVKQVNSETDDLYGRLKRMIIKKPWPGVFVYHFKPGAVST